MSTTTLPDDIQERLAELHAECPGCHGDMKAENDERMRTGLAWYCPNPDCTEEGGCWIVTEGDIRKAVKSCQADTKNPIALAEAQALTKQCIEKYPNALETGLAASCFDSTYSRSMERITRNQPS